MAAIRLNPKTPIFQEVLKNENDFQENIQERIQAKGYTLGAVALALLFIAGLQRR